MSIEIHDPLHPGIILREAYLSHSGLTVAQAADALAVSRNTLSELLNGRRGVSVDMALRLAKAFKTSPELWLNLQQHYDLWHRRRVADVSAVREIGVTSGAAAGA